MEGVGEGEGVRSRDLAGVATQTRREVGSFPRYCDGFGPLQLKVNRRKKV